jgi:hypothetical protein
MNTSRSLSLLLVVLYFSVNTAFAKGEQDVNVINTPTVNVGNTVTIDNTDVPVTIQNDSTNPVPVRSVVRRIPISCVVVPSFEQSGNHDARCIGPDGVVTPVPPGFFLAITDVIATSQAVAGTTGQAVVRVSSRNQGGTQFGAGVPMVLKPGETQSLHYRSPDQVLPAGRIPTASVGINLGDVFPVEVRFTGYLVAEDDLGL